MAITKGYELGQLANDLTVDSAGSITIENTIIVDYEGFDSDFTNALSSNITVTGNIAVTGTVDGRDVAADGTKLDGIEAAATADQTKSDIEGLGIDVPAANLTGTIPAARLSTATTQAESDDSTKIATTAYVVDKITTLIGGAPSTLNDLNELAAAINDDANYNSTLTTALATKLPKAGGTMTGNLVFGDTVNPSGAQKRVIFGDSTDLEIYHENATSGFRANYWESATNTINFIWADIVVMLAKSGNAKYIELANYSTKLYYQNSLRLTTTSSGTEFSGNVLFADNGKAIFGAGSDLQIYHNSANNKSYIEESGTGNLVIRGSDIDILAGNGEAAINVAQDGAVTLYNDNNAKLATTATGVDVTGTITSDGLTVDGVATIQGVATGLVINETDTTDLNTYFNVNSGDFNLMTTNDAFTSFTTRLNVDHSTGDISFYEDTGTTPKFFWDASVEGLGIGDTSFTNKLNVTGAMASAGTPLVQLSENSGNARDGLYLDYTGTTNSAVYSLKIADASKTHLAVRGDGNVGIGITNPQQLLHIHNSSGSFGAEAVLTGRLSTGTPKAEVAFKRGTSGDGAMLVLRSSNSSGTLLDALTVKDGSGNVGIGTTSPSALLHVESADGTAGGAIKYTSSGVASGYMSADAAGLCLATDTAGITFRTGITSNDPTDTGTERMRITAAGSVGIGTSSPSTTLDLVGNWVSNTGQLSIDTPSGETYSGLAILNNGSVKGFLYHDNSAGTLDLQTYTTDALRFKTNNAERMRIDSSGNVGIGTTSPYGKLQIEGDTGTWATAPMLVFSTTSTATAAVRDWAIGPADSNYGYFHINQGASTGASPLATSNVRFTISDTGNVGIGTATPQLGSSWNKVLHVHSPGGVGSHIRFTDTTSGETGESGLYIGQYGNDAYLINRESGFMALRVNGTTDAIRITSSAFVGLNNDNPQSSLAVYHSAASAYSSTADSTSNMSGIRVTASPNENVMTGIWFGTGTDQTGAHWTGIAGSRTSYLADWGTRLSFYTHPTATTNVSETYERMTIDPAGNVGIGTTSPNFPLHINKGTSSYSPSPGVNENLFGVNSTYDAAGSQGITFSRLDGNWLDGTTGPDTAFGWLWNFQNSVRGGITYDHRSSEQFQIFSSYAPIVFYTTDAADGNAVPTDSNMNERLRISSNGISFNGDTAAANSLNDYEEGTWTPTCAKGANGTLSVTGRQGRYTKIGNIVHYYFYWYYSGSSSMSGTDIYTIGGFPYAISSLANGAYQFSPGGYIVMNSTTHYDYHRWQANASNSLTLYGNYRSTNHSSGVLEFSGSGSFRIA